jgi:hypothetical protein
MGYPHRNASSISVFSLMLCGVFLIAVVVFTIGLILSHLRDRAIAENEQQLLATATLLAKQADRDFQALELVAISLIAAPRAAPERRQDCASGRRTSNRTIKPREGTRLPRRRMNADPLIAPDS